jgi:hypothetical protein
MTVMISSPSSKKAYNIRHWLGHILIEQYMGPNIQRKGMHTGSDGERGADTLLSNMLQAWMMLRGMCFGGFLWLTPNEPSVGEVLRLMLGLANASGKGSPTSSDVSLEPENRRWRRVPLSMARAWGLVH